MTIIVPNTFDGLLKLTDWTQVGFNALRRENLGEYNDRTIMLWRLQKLAGFSEAYLKEEQRRDTLKDDIDWVSNQPLSRFDALTKFWI